MRLGDLDNLKTRVKKSRVSKVLNVGMQVFIETEKTIDPESLPIVQELREEIAELKKLCDKLEEAERAVAHLTPDWVKKIKPGDKVLSSTPNIFTPTLRIRTVKYEKRSNSVRPASNKGTNAAAH